MAVVIQNCQWLSDDPLARSLSGIGAGLSIRAGPALIRERYAITPTAMATRIRKTPTPTHPILTPVETSALSVLSEATPRHTNPNRPINVGPPTRRAIFCRCRARSRRRSK